MLKSPASSTGWPERATKSFTRSHSHLQGPCLTGAYSASSLQCVPLAGAGGGGPDLPSCGMASVTTRYPGSASILQWVSSATPPVPSAT